MEEEKQKKTIEFKHKKFLVLGVALIAFIIAIIFDSKTALFFSSIRNSVLDFLMIGIVVASIYMIPIIPSIFLFFEDKRNLIKYWFSLALTLFVIILIKMIVHRERPFQALDFAIPTLLVKESYSLWDFSFPSNHSALSFTALPFLKGKFLVIWLLISILIIFSRLYFGLHYLSDAIFGMILGFIIPTLVIKHIK